ncbi:MAG: hypothetical protein V7651_09210 [Hyphomonas oceanitis]|uniref:hypothetical protein n=1 Tax=Hyphomonas oceanitis TaxID=81033 RepID=UPI003002A902
MVQPPLLTPSMCKSVTVLATAERNGEISPGVAEAFVDETKRLPLTHISDRVHAIRMVANKVGRLPEDQLEVRRRHAQRGATCWYDLLSGDGFRRERFLLEVHEGAPSAFLLTMFLRRLNDWVPQVRVAARQAAENVLDRTDPDIVGEVLWSILSVRNSWKRMRGDESAVLDAGFERPSITPYLVRRLLSETAGPTARVLQQACRGASLDPYLPRLAEAALQPAVRGTAYRMLMEQRATWADGWRWRWTDKSLGERVREPKIAERTLTISVDLRELLVSAANDPSAAVRRVAGDALISHRDELGDFATVLAEKLATDPYPSIANRGRFILREQSLK